MSVVDNIANSKVTRGRITWDLRKYVMLNLMIAISKV
jgi:hypothetical protein